MPLVWTEKRGHSLRWPGPGSSWDRLQSPRHRENRELRQECKTCFGSLSIPMCSPLPSPFALPTSSPLSALASCFTARRPTASPAGDSLATPPGPYGPADGWTRSAPRPTAQRQRSHAPPGGVLTQASGRARGSGGGVSVIHRWKAGGQGEGGGRQARG